MIFHPRSVCAKFGIDRGTGSGDKSRAKSVIFDANALTLFIL